MTKRFKLLLCLILITLILFTFIYFGKYNENSEIVIKVSKIKLNYTSCLNKDILSTRINNFCNNKEGNFKKKQITIGDKNIVFNLFNDNDIVSQHIEEHSTWEKDILNTIIKLLNKTSSYVGKKLSFLDIGSNIGWFSIIISSYGYNTIAFEPMNENIEIMSKNLCDNNLLNVTLFQTGLGDKEGKCWLVSGNINFGDGLLICDKKPQNQFKSDGYMYTIRQEINITLLDNYFNFNINPYIGIMKIDVEGFEENVFKGGMKFFENYPPYYIFIEFLTNKPQLVNLLYNLGYYLGDVNCENPIYNEKDTKLFIKNRDLCFIHKNVILNKFI